MFAHHRIDVYYTPQMTCMSYVSYRLSFVLTEEMFLKQMNKANV